MRFRQLPLAVFVLTVALFALAFAGRARADIEVCPATALSVPLSASANGIGVVLAGQTARSVEGELELYTDHGFFTATLPSVALTAAPGRPPRDDAFASPILDVQLPDGVKVYESWLRSVTVTAGRADWMAIGAFTCYPPDGDPTHPYFPKSPHPSPSPEPLRTPDPGFAPVVASAAPGLETLNCKHPFLMGHAYDSVAPAYPQVTDSTHGVSLIEVEIDPTGALLEASVYQSSGSAYFDNQALMGARQTKYLPPVAFCRTVFGRYIYHANFGIGS